MLLAQAVKSQAVATAGDVMASLDAPIDGIDDEPAAWLADAEAILHESDDPKAIQSAWEMVDGSDEVSPADNKRLGALFNERMKEFVSSN